MITAMLISFLLLLLLYSTIFHLDISNSLSSSLAYTEDASESLDTVDNIYANFITEQLENFTKHFEYKFDLDGKQIFPNDTIKQDIVTKYKSSEYNIASLKYELLGFKITASDIKINVNPTKIDKTKTRIDIPLMLAKNVKVSNGLINLAYNEIDLGSIYGIYDITTDKMTVHVPIGIASNYLPK